jgi:hypothetical protein
VTVVDTVTGCENDACGELTVLPLPTCEIVIVDPPVCPSEGGNFLSALTTGGVSTGLWEITAGNGWAIVGDNTAQTIEYSVGPDASECATFTLTVFTSDGCESECTIEVCCTGDTFCTFTQGYWGNEGGTKCDPSKTTTELINQALAAAPVPGQITVGQAGHSITFNSAADVLLRLPCGGKPSALPAGDFSAGDQTALVAAKLVKKKGDAINNVLVGQVVALTLNLLVSDGCIEESGDLATWTLPAEFCVLGEDLCAEKYEIPSSLVGMTVQELLDAANAALAGSTAISISDIYGAATSMNEGFDECVSLISCPTEEICGNGCDDDFDDLIDEGCDDPA